jgi:hypothetical protein
MGRRKRKPIVFCPAHYVPLCSMSLATKAVQPV